jgi:hypothetical protein
MLNAAAFTFGVDALPMSRQAQGSTARAAWHCATRGGEAMTTRLKLKKPARPPAVGDLALSSVGKYLEIIISPN